MPSAQDTLLHWICERTTYSVKRLPGNKGYLIITDPGGGMRKGRRSLPYSEVEAWARLPIPERCELAEREAKRSNRDSA